MSDADTTAPGLPRPVLIGGSGRSGTTLLAAMLGVGPGNLTVPEAEFKWTLFDARRGPDQGHDMAAALAALRGDWRFRRWGLTLRDHDLLRPPASSPQEFLSRLAVAYGRSIGKHGTTVWIDHTPGNVRYLVTLRQLLPDARFIHLVRDGRAVAASIMPLDWGPNTIVEAARYWTGRVAMGTAAAAMLGPTRLRTVRYEDLLAEPERTLRALCGFLQVPFSEEMIGTRDFVVDRYTAGQHELVSAAPDPQRAQAWRERLTGRQVETFEHITGELLAYLGYPLFYGARARKPRARTRVREAVQGTVRRQVWDKARRRARQRHAGR